MKNKILVSIIVLATALISCQDDWDGHYKGQQEGTAEGSPEKLGDFLSLEERYSAFTDFLKETGVLDTLNANQILTVWAVDNKNMPTPEELGQWSDKEKKQIALNMLNYMPIYYPKFENGKKIQTLAGKNIFMGIDTDGFMLDGIDIVSTNQVCSNGVIHEIAGLIVPRKNLYEYIESLPDNYSMLRDSLLARNDTIFDTERSFPVGVDPTGNTIYDSVFVIHNNFIGSIRDEESKSTVMLPDNRVIQEAFEEMRNYLLADTLSTELKEEMNDWWLKALIYPGELSVYDKDKSIYSIYNKHWRTDIQEVNRAEAVPVSNGLIYPVTKFVFPKSSLLKDVEYIIPDLWQRATATERETYFAYGGKGYTTTSSEIIYVDAQLNKNPWAKDVSNTWWRAHSSRKTETDTVYAEFTILEKDMKNKVIPTLLYPGTYDVYVWLRSYAAVPVTISVISDAVEGTQLQPDGRYSQTLQEQASQSAFSKTDVASSYYQGIVGTIKLTKPTRDLRFNFIIWSSGSNKNINIRGIKLVANRDEMY